MNIAIRASNSKLLIFKFFAISHSSSSFFCYSLLWEIILPGKQQIRVNIVSAWRYKTVPKSIFAKTPMYQWLSHKVNNLQTKKDVFSIDIVIVFCPSMLPFRIFRKMSKFDFKINSIQSSEENKCYKYRTKIGSHYFGHMKGHTKLINHIFGPMNIESQSSKIATSQKLHINTYKYHLPQFA